MKTGIIYKVTSSSGKSYIGQTIQDFSNRKSAHYIRAHTKNLADYKFAKAIRKYGDALEWIIIYSNIPIHQLANMERWCIGNYNTFNRGYNSTEGGAGQIGRPVSDITKKKISEALKGNKNWLGKRHSSQSKKKMSDAKKGKPHKGPGNAKINLKIAQKIREQYATGKYTQKKLAEEHNIDKSSISLIVNNLQWINRDCVSSI